MARAEIDALSAALHNSEATEVTSGEADGKRLATEEGTNPRSPKRPRLFSPGQDAASSEVKDNQAARSALPAVGEPGLNQPAVPMTEAGAALPAQRHDGAAATVTTAATMAAVEAGAAGIKVSNSNNRMVTPDLSSSGPPTSAPSHQTRLDNLPVLSSLAGQLLSALAKMPPGEGLTLIRNLHLANYQEYRTIRSLLEPVLGLYRTGPSFLIHTQLGMTTASQIEILRKANQALWLASIFTGEVGLRDMNQSFLFVFVPEQGKLSKNQGNILLELKTQAFITAHRLRAADPRVVLADLFSNDMDQQILSRRSGGQPLAPSEQEFLKRLASRRDVLDEHIRLNKLDELELRYGWSEFSKEISSYIYKTYGNGVPPVSTTNAGAVAGLGAGAAGAGATQGQTWLQKPPTQAATAAPAPARPLEYPERPLHTYPRLIPNNQDDWMAQLARAYDLATKEYTAKAEKLAATAPAATAPAAPAPAAPAPAPTAPTAPTTAPTAPTASATPASAPGETLVMTQQQPAPNGHLDPAPAASAEQAGESVGAVKDTKEVKQEHQGTGIGQSNSTRAQVGGEGAAGAKNENAGSDEAAAGTGQE